MDKLLFDPDWFFSEKLKNKIDLKIPFLILLINGIIAAITSILMISKIVSSSPSDMAPFMAIGGVIGAVGGILIVYLMWLILSGIFYLLAGLFLSEVEFKRVFEFVGYGFVPVIFSSIIGIVTLYAMLPSMEFSFTDPTLMEMSLKKMLENPLSQIAQVIGIVFTLWSGYIWVFAVKNATSITTKNALIVVGIPVGLYLIYEIYSVITLVFLP